MENPMWIVMNDSFVSAVEHEKNKNLLVVRARVKGDLERLIPGCRVITTTDRDYLFRTFISKNQFARIVSQRVQNIDYGNFKDSVPEKVRATAYGRIWSVMFGLQETLHRDLLEPSKNWWVNYRAQRGY